MQENTKNIFSINQRLIDFVDSIGVTRYSFSKSTGVSEAVLLNIYKGKNKPSMDILEKIKTKYPDVNLDWLISGEGEMLKTKSKEFLIKEKDKVNDKEFDKKRKVQNSLPFDKSMVSSEHGIPYYENLPASAGDFTAFFDDVMATSFLDLPQFKGCDAVLPVQGTSMKGIIEPGDLIVVKEMKNRNEFDPTLPYMVITDENRMIKHLRVDDIDESIIWAESTNHHKIRLHGDNIKKVYAIKGVIRFY